MKIVSGQGCYLFDETGAKFLDAGVSSALAGHAHPAVAAAIAKQAAALSASTAFASTIEGELKQRLSGLYPAELSRYYTAQSLTEATELALRIARSDAPGKDIIVLDQADFGGTTTLTNMSPARATPKHWVHVAQRGDAGNVREVIQRIHASGRGLCALFVDGTSQVGYLPAAFDAARTASGVTIAIEAGVGLGRVGQTFWGFQAAGATPDIAVIGEELGNGMGIGAVMVRAELAESFDANVASEVPIANPVACAAAIATLDLLEREELARNADEVGGKLLGQLRGMGIAVRGVGLSLEIDVPDGANAVTQLCHAGILIARRGDTLLVRPPLCLKQSQADQIAESVRSVMRAAA